MVVQVCSAVYGVVSSVRWGFESLYRDFLFGINRFDFGRPTLGHSFLIVIPPSHYSQQCFSHSHFNQQCFSHFNQFGFIVNIIPLL